MRQRLFVYLASWALIAAAFIQPAAAISIDVNGSETVAPGASSLITVKLRTMGAEVVGTQNRIGFSPPLRIPALANGAPDCSVSQSINKSGTGFRFVPTGCIGTACTGVKAFVLSLENLDPIPDNSLLYSCRVTVAANAATGDYQISNTGLGASDAAGHFLRADGANGTVRVRGATMAIDIGDVEAAPGDDAEVEVRLRRMGAPVVGLQNRIDFTDPLRIPAGADGQPDCTVNPAIDKAATTFRFAPVGCSGSACTGVRIAVLSFENVTIIPDDAVLYTCRVEVADGAPDGDYLLRNGETRGSDAGGVSLPATGRNGVVTVTPDDALVAIEIGTTRAVSGQRAVIDVRLRSLEEGAAPAAGTQNEIVFDPTTPIGATPEGEPDCSVNPAIDKDGTSFLFLPTDCVPNVDCERVRAFVLALDNTDPIPDGTLLYQCDVQVASDAPVGVYTLRNENAVAGDSHGDPVLARGRNGRVEVICAGDCDGNGQVQIFELLRGVNILLGNEQPVACGVFDSNRSGDVNVNEIVQAVSSALRGCRLPE